MEENKEKNKLNEILFIIIIAVIISISSIFFIRFATVEGHSMDNTLNDGQILLIKVFNIHPERGDIITIERPDLSIRFLIKRVIAVEGDIIEIKNNILYLNGEAIKEDYIKEPMYTEDYPAKTIPEGKVFVMGDNRNVSMDSRSNVIGLVDKKEILGKAVFSISDFKLIEK
ncbi:signal peptidase I [Clostridium paraputrificum]|uniref:signal peptidase I n=1 Tax=Clostridium paraputrificum TaxID=29363 RepID=UPI00232C5497|nr:signal peptidase I [Clostridium paraputrificum]MDB2077657.1 signal peptidase I [Clostridium paraputrificum]